MHSILKLEKSSSPYEVGDLIISYLKQLKVEYVFGIPGGFIESFYNALARGARNGGPKSVIARHETGAAFMADGYSRHSGKLGVCCATAGPGTTNLVTGVASAYDNYSPLLVITAQTSLANFGWGCAQESSDTGINTVDMLKSCTHYSSLVSHPNQIEKKLIASIATSFKAPGPTHLSIPLDILRNPAPTLEPSYDLAKSLEKHRLSDPESLEILFQALVKSKKTVFIVGDRCSYAIEEILDFALRLNISVVATPHARGLINSYHPLFQGVIGFAGHESATDFIQDESVDTIVAIGTAFTETTSNGWDPMILSSDRLIHVDSSEKNLSQSPMARLQVFGNIEEVFKQLKRLLRPDHTKLSNPKVKLNKEDAFSTVLNDQDVPKMNFKLNDESKCYDDSVPIKPQRLMHELTNLFPPETCYLCDSGNSMAWAIHYLHPYDRKNMSAKNPNDITFWTCLEYGSMGWAIGSSIGTAIATPGKPVVCLTGDGAMLMSGGEVATAVQEELPVIFVVLNNSQFGMVKHGQRIAQAEPIGYQLTQVDFCAMAKAFGIPGYLIHSAEDLYKLEINNVINRKGPTILDVRIDSDEIPPIHSRLRTLGTLE